MATTKDVTLKTSKLAPAKQDNSLKGMLSNDNIKNRFNEILGKNSAAFISSLLAVANNNELLMKSDPATIIGAGATAAAMNLPVNQNFGFAYIIPFHNGKTNRYEAQFQLGYKGYIQLAMRTGQYKAINAVPVYEGEVKCVNRFTGEYEFGERTGDEIIGYMAYFKLINGFEKFLYMDIEEMQAHARKYSRNYKGGTDRWGLTDFHTMAVKTVLKRLLSKYGILSIEMQGSNALATALENDGGVITIDSEGHTVTDFDGETLDAAGDTFMVGNDIVDADTGEVIDDNNINEMFDK